MVKFNIISLLRTNRVGVLCIKTNVVDNEG